MEAPLYIYIGVPLSIEGSMVEETSDVMMVVEARFFWSCRKFTDRFACTKRTGLNTPLDVNVILMLSEGFDFLTILEGV